MVLGNAKKKLALITILFVQCAQNEVSTEASFFLAEQFVEELRAMKRPDIHQYFHKAPLLIENGLNEDLRILYETLYEEYDPFPTLTYDSIVFHKNEIKAGVPYYFSYKILGNNGKKGELRIYIDPEVDLFYTLKIRHLYD